MEILIIGIIAGVVGTIVMDALNHVFARLGILSKIDARMIGRMAVGWAHGRFRYRYPQEMKQVAKERFYGYLTHYGIGVGLAIPFFLGWHLASGEIAPPLWTFIYGLATTAASYFIVYPCMGQGLFGMRSQDRSRNVVSSLANHMFFAAGMAVVVAFA